MADPDRHEYGVGASMRDDLRFSFAMSPDQPVELMLEAIELADRLDFDACSLADEIYHQDPWQILAVAATRTYRIRLMPNTHVVLKEPTYLAQQLMTLDAISGGRASALISTGNLGMLRQYGYEPSALKLIPRLREAHSVMRTFLDTQKIDHNGRFYTYSGLMTTARPTQPRIPLLMGGIKGPKSFELAGEVADGIKTGLAYSREALGYAINHVKIGAERAGRDWRLLDLVAGLVGAIAEDGTAAREASRVLAAFWIPALGDEAAERHGIDPVELQPIKDAFERGDPQVAVRLAPEHITDRLAMPVGSPEDWVRQLSEIVLPLGYNHISVMVVDPHGIKLLTGSEVPGLPSTGEQVQLIHDRVIPAVKAAYRRARPESEGTSV